MKKYKPFIRPLFYCAVLAAIVAFMFTTGNVQAQTDRGTANTAPIVAAAGTPKSGAPDPAEAGIDWMEKTKQGGFTMVALVILSVIGLVFVLERILAVRAKHFAPIDLSRSVHRAIEGQDDAEALAACDRHPSILASTYRYIFEHKDNPVDTISAGACDIAGREVRDMHARTNPLAVIASLAPLLGLLGTMIGMIEAFDKVAYYGDDANASLLADSISKALITTAVGLVLAIPAIAAYNFFKYRINTLTGILETEVESVINHLYLKGERPVSKPRVNAGKTSSQADHSVSAADVIPAQ
jgi:biopolymer transport protein ExbB/TolQ